MKVAGNDAHKKLNNLKDCWRSRFKKKFVSNHKSIQQNSGHGTQNALMEMQTQLIKESMERKDLSDGRTVYLWTGDGYNKTSSPETYLLESKDSEAVTAVKYYLDLKEIDKQAETKSTDIKHTLDSMSQLCKKSSTEDLTRFLGTVEGLRHDTTGEKFRRDNAGSSVGNHQNTNSPGKPKETPRTGRTSVANVDDSPHELSSVPRKRLFSRPNQGNAPSFTATATGQGGRPKDNESTGHNEAITNYRSPTGETRSNQVGSNYFEIILSSGHELLRAGQRSIYPSVIRQIIERGTIVPNPQHQDKINYEWRGKVVSVLKCDRNSSTKRICTVFDRRMSTEKEQIKNFLKYPIRSEYENDDEYKKDCAFYLRAKDAVAKKYFKAENEINRLKNHVAHLEDHGHLEDHWDVDYLDQPGHNDSKRRRNDLQHGPNKRRRRNDDDYHHDNNRQRQSGSGYRGHSNNESLGNNRSGRRSTGSATTDSSRNNYSPPHRKQD